MIIHVVKEGETISYLANYYEIPVNTLIQDNGITNPDNLALGQTIVIIYPETVYKVKEGDSLKSIADYFQVTINHILRNNPVISDRGGIYEGENIVINYDTDKLRMIVISGYAYPYIDMKILKKTLPYLTYLTVFNYRITIDGDIIDIDDKAVIEMAKLYGVAPMMFLSTLTSHGQGDLEVAKSILNNIELQEKLFENTINKLKEKGYHGVNLYLQYLAPETKQLVEQFLERFSKRLREEKFRILAAVSPKTRIEGTEISFEQMDYSNIAAQVDALLFLSYDWGYSYGPPASVTPVNILKGLFNIFINQVTSNKLQIGLPVIGYDWELPYIPGVTRANAISTATAIEIAASAETTIHYNDITEAPYFFYNKSIHNLHIVWFKDARSIDAISGFVNELDLQGLAIWNTMQFFNQMWFILNNKYEIEKVYGDNLTPDMN